MKVIIQPEDGPAPLLSALKNAKKSIEIAIFRLDRSDLETTLKAAAAKGVKVTALIADVNRGGEKNLRKLETRFLQAGIIVARSADDLVRYHDKLIIIDRRILIILSFNFTHQDIDHSRGFGVITKNAALVQEAVGGELPDPAVEQQSRGERKVGDNDQRYVRRRILQEQQHKKHDNVGYHQLAGNPAKARERKGGETGAGKACHDFFCKPNAFSQLPGSRRMKTL